MSRTAATQRRSDVLDALAGRGRVEAERIGGPHGATTELSTSYGRLRLDGPPHHTSDVGDGHTRVWRLDGYLVAHSAVGTWTGAEHYVRVDPHVESD